jgi:hypothetical protein
MSHSSNAESRFARKLFDFAKWLLVLRNLAPQLQPVFVDELCVLFHAAGGQRYSELSAPSCQGINQLSAVLVLIPVVFAVSINEGAWNDMAHS